MHLIDTGLETKTGGRVKRRAFIGDEHVHADLRRRRRRRRPRRPARVPPTPRQARDGHRRAAAARFGGLVFDGDRVARFTEKPQVGEAGSTAASSCSSLGRSTTSTATTQSGSANRSSAGARRPAVAYRHDGFWQCMDTLRDVRAARRPVEQRQRAVEGSGRDQPASGTTARRWSPARPAWSAAGSSASACDAGADVVCLVRDWVPQSELVRTGLLDRSARSFAATSAIAICWSACSASTRSTPSFIWPRRRSSASPTAIPSRRSKATSRGTWRLLEACRRSPHVKHDRARLVRQGLWRAETLPYNEETPLAGRHPYDVSKSCADLIAQSYAKTYGLPVAITRCGNFYGGGDLNWNRIVPGTIRSIFRGQRPDHPLRRPVRARLLLCRRRRRRVHASRRTALARDPTSERRGL